MASPIIASGACGVAVIMLNACTVGPDYQKPAIETPSTWHDLHVASSPEDASAAQPPDLTLPSRAAHARASRAASSASPESPESPESLASSATTPHASGKPTSSAAASEPAVAGASSLQAGRPASPPQRIQSNPVEQADPDPQWWRSFHDPVLDALIDRAANDNLDLRQAVLRIEEARTQIQSAAAQGLPNVRANGSYTREQLGIRGFLDDDGVPGKIAALGTPNSPINSVAPGAGAAAENGANNLVNQLEAPVNLWQDGFDASWELDLFGRVRRSVESAQAQTQQAIENRNDALVSLEAEVAQTYLQLRGAQAMHALTVELIDEQRGVVDLTRSQARAGITSDVDVESANAQLTTTQAQLPQYDQQMAQALNGLCYLLGMAPGSLDDMLAAPSAIPGIPPDVPVGMPSTLARRRPDIRAAEAQLHAATAEVGVAVAQFYPDISLTGQIGMRGTHARDLAHWSSLFYSFGPSISLPVFEGGQLVANLKLTKVQQQEAAIAYRKAVLTALRDVDNALAVYRTDQSRQDAVGHTVAAQQTSFDLARDSYRKGIVSFINVLDAQRQLAQARLQYVQGTMQVTTDLVALYKALGGGWESGANDAQRGSLSATVAGSRHEAPVGQEDATGH
ncbi:MAG TPA: efflux transporter outer membrane subunit [Pararobbsia sp.]|nr:efflux transporter outer membrane subunit [Pararobbsia sp.]